MHDVNVLDLLLIEAGAFYIMDRGYLDFERLYALHQASAFFVTRAKRNLDARRVYSAPVDRDTGIICDQTIALNGFYCRQGLSRATCVASAIGSRDRQDAGVPDQQVRVAGADHLRAVQVPMAGGAVLQVDQAASAHQALLRHFRERCADANLDRRSASTCWWRSSRRRLNLDASLHTLLQILSLTLFEKMPLQQAFAGSDTDPNSQRLHNQLNLFEF